MLDYGTILIEEVEIEIGGHSIDKHYKDGIKFGRINYTTIKALMDINI